MLKVGAFVMLGSIASMAVFGSLPVAITPMLIVTFIIGIFLSGSMIGPTPRYRTCTRCRYVIPPCWAPVSGARLCWARISQAMIQGGWERFALTRRWLCPCSYCLCRHQPDPAVSAGSPTENLQTPGLRAATAVGNSPIQGCYPRDSRPPLAILTARVLPGVGQFAFGT